MGMQLNDMQDALLARVKEIFPSPKYQVEDWPDDPVNYQFAHSNAAVLLVFKDRKFDKPQATDGTIQPNEPVFQLGFMARSLRSKGDRTGAYELLDRARAGDPDDDQDNGLAGFELSQGNLWIKREKFIRMKPGGVWVFGQDWVTTDVFD